MAKPRWLNFSNIWLLYSCLLGKKQIFCLFCGSLLPRKLQNKKFFCAQFFTLIFQTRSVIQCRNFYGKFSQDVPAIFPGWSFCFSYGTKPIHPAVNVTSLLPANQEDGVTNKTFPLIRPQTSGEKWSWQPSTPFGMADSRFSASSGISRAKRKHLPEPSDRDRKRTLSPSGAHNAHFHWMTDCGDSQLRRLFV